MSIENNNNNNNNDNNENIEQQTQNNSWRKKLFGVINKIKNVGLKPDLFAKHLFFIPFILLLFTLFLSYNTEITLTIDSFILKINKFRYSNFSTHNYKIVERLIHKSLALNKLLLAKKYIIEYNNISKSNNNLKKNYIPELIIIDILYGNIDSALYTLNEALNVYKENSDIKNLYLLLYNSKIHNYENLIRIYTKIDKEKSSNEQILQQLKIAYIYFLKKEYNYSEKIYLDLLQNNKISQIDKLNIYLILSEIYIEKSNFIEAQHFLKQYSILLNELSKNSENTKEFLSIEEIKIHLVDARMKELQNKNTIKIYKNLLIKKSKFFPKADGLNKKKQANDYILETYIIDKLGDAYLANSEKDKAVKQYLRALKIRKKYIPAYQICSYKKLNKIDKKGKKDLFSWKIINEFSKYNISINDFCRIEFEYL